MENPFQPAVLKKKYLKIYLYGDSGVGKTWFGLGFPNPALIDLEGGADFYSDVFKFSVLDTKSFKDTLKAVEFLETGKHEYKTVIVDPVTIVYEALQEGRMEYKLSKKNKDISGDNIDFNGLDWGQMKRFYKVLMNKLVNLPMHLVLIAREKDKYAKGKEMVIIGTQGDAEKSTPYATDIRFRLTSCNNKRIGIIEKDRTRHWNEGDKIENPSWKSFEAILEKTKDMQEIVTHSSNIEANTSDRNMFNEKIITKTQNREKGSVTGLPPKQRFLNSLDIFKASYNIEAEHLLKYVCKKTTDEIKEEDVVKISQLWLELEANQIKPEKIINV